MSVIGTRRSTINKRRKGKLAIILPWLRRFGFAVVFLVIAGWTASWFFLSDADTKTADWIERKTWDTTAAMGFTVEDILVEGRINGDVSVLKAIVNIKKGDPLFSFDPAEAKSLIERVDWVRSAHVERRFPGTIYILINERTPSVLFQKDRKMSLLDEEGEIITSHSLAKFKDLIVVMGDGAPEKAASLLANLKAEPTIYKRIKSATWISKRRWDLVLKSGVKVKLPENDMPLALRRLAFSHEEDAILDKDVRSIDLREPDRIVIRTRPGAVQEYKAGLKTGSNI